MKELDKQIEVMQWFANGGEIEYTRVTDISWHAAPTPIWDWVAYDYRINEVKPEPVYYYQWKKLDGAHIDVTSYTIADMSMSHTRIDSSKTTFDQLI